MGCGKSRVGEALSQCIDIPYVDLDSFIEQQEKTSIKSIFEDKGELFFGKIDYIQNGTVSFTEMLPDGAGCWQKKQATITMLSKAGENNV